MDCIQQKEIVMLTINVILYVSTLFFVMVTSRYLMGLFFLLVIMLSEIPAHGIEHSCFLVLCEITLAIFVVKETSQKKGSSPLLAYNPFYEKNKLNSKVRFGILFVFSLAFAIRLFSFFVWGR